MEQNNNDNEFKHAQMQYLNGINITLRELSNQISKQNKLLDDIKFNTNVIGFILLIPFIIKIILLLTGAYTGYNILQGIL